MKLCIDVIVPVYVVDMAEYLLFSSDGDVVYEIAEGL